MTEKEKIRKLAMCFKKQGKLTVSEAKKASKAFLGHGQELLTTTALNALENLGLIEIRRGTDHEGDLFHHGFWVRTQKPVIW